MLLNEFQNVYNLFKMKFYESLCSNSDELTMQEAFSLDVIYMLKEPTILEFANYMNISQSNATYKINQMIKKGYLTKEVNENDKRAFTLKVTDKFLDCYRMNDEYVTKIIGEIESLFKKEDVEQISKLLKTINIYMSYYMTHDE
jgi:DNA-binding MarR family transcriptional regulator